MRRTLPLAAFLLATTTHAQLVINEVDYDQAGTDNAEYLELKNTGSAPVALQMVSLMMVNGGTGTPAVYASEASPSWPELAPGAYFTLCPSGCPGELHATSNAIQNGPNDAIVLIDLSDSSIIDMVAYEGDVAGYTEGTGTSAADDNVSTSRSIGRWPDGADTDQNANDFIVMCGTPGAANVGDTVGCSTSTGITTAQRSTGFTVFTDPGNGLVWMRAEQARPGAVTFEVFAVDGSLLARRVVDKGTAPSWAWNTGGLHGRVLLLRVTTATGSAVRRIVLP